MENGLRMASKYRVTDRDVFCLDEDGKRVYQTSDGREVKIVSPPFMCAIEDALMPLRSAIQAMGAADENNAANAALTLEHLIDVAMEKFDELHYVLAANLGGEIIFDCDMYRGTGRVLDVRLGVSETFSITLAESINR